MTLEKKEKMKTISFLNIVFTEIKFEKMITDNVRNLIITWQKSWQKIIM